MLVSDNNLWIINRKLVVNKFMLIYADVVYVSALLWTAPELLRSPNRPPGGTKRADVYSFGIIMQEIVTRTRPYCLFVDKEPKGKYCRSLTICAWQDSNKL